MIVVEALRFWLVDTPTWRRDVRSRRDAQIVPEMSRGGGRKVPAQRLDSIKFSKRPNQKHHDDPAWQAGPSGRDFDDRETGLCLHHSLVMYTSDVKTRTGWDHPSSTIGCRSLTSSSSVSIAERCAALPAGRTSQLQCAWVFLSRTITWPTARRQIRAVPPFSRTRRETSNISRSEATMPIA